MASNANYYFGFELLNQIVDSKLSKKEDVLVLFVHWYLVRNGFKCIGFGDSKTFDPKSDQGSDVLPPEWNKKPNYALRYVKDEKLYVMVATKSDADLLINFLRVHDNTASSVTFSIDGTVSKIHGPLESLIPTYKDVANKIRIELVEPLHSGQGREISTQTSSRTVNPENRRASDDDPLRVRPGPHRPGPVPWNPLADPRNIGRADLDPFGGPGGGMIFDPFTPERGLPPPFAGGPEILPRGAVPPGARFDPIGPMVNPPRGHFRNTGDEAPPPGYDDMFM